MVFKGFRQGCSVETRFGTLGEIRAGRAPPWRRASAPPLHGSAVGSAPGRFACISQWGGIGFSKVLVRAAPWRPDLGL